MHRTAALRRNFEPGLPRVLGSAEPEQLESRLRDRIELERLRKQTDNDLAELRSEKARLAGQFEQPAPEDFDPDWLADAAKRVLEKERKAERHFLPVIARLRDALGLPRDRLEPYVRQLLLDGIEVLEGWLALYHGYSTMLARQAAERQSPGKILRARTVEGEVDHDALTRDIIERFPKILAALAE